MLYDGELNRITRVSVSALHVKSLSNIIKATITLCGKECSGNEGKTALVTFLRKGISLEQNASTGAFKDKGIHKRRS